MITVMKGTIRLELPRKDLVTIEPTHDGVVLNLQNGCHFYLADQFMPIETKQLLAAAPGAFLNGKLEINLDNYRQPVKVNFIDDKADVKENKEG